MSLLSPSEAHTFNSFLSNVELGDILNSEWNALVDNVPVPTARGKEALSKATKDLMSLEPPLPPIDTLSAGKQHQQQPTLPVVNSNWPSLPGESERRPHQQSNYTYGFGVTRPPSRPFFHTTSSSPFSTPGTSASSSAFTIPRAYSPTANNELSSPSSFFPSVSDGPSQGLIRQGPFGVPSGSSALTQQSAVPKRPLPPDGDGSVDLSGALAKRRRPSVVTQDLMSPIPVSEDRSQASSSSRNKLGRSPSLSSSTTAGPSLSQEGSSRPALLSPSQKRANHIQSEQKRRANIRKGYEALCEAVPALREAIRMEEEAARAAEEDKEKGKKRKRKNKNAAPQPEDTAALDGRAGPKSENVVLQKTIDHLHALLAERDALKERLNTARAALSPGHPALQIAPKNLSDDKVPLWEREWNGGNGWNDDAGDDE
ncbi:hypothetical protein EIP86_002205 [Pleurotus ostreatoroseus]|nr:hypothetical protein EIP86_002205 [Pleurotus ostreatoroseus]